MRNSRIASPEIKGKKAGSFPCRDSNPVKPHRRSCVCSLLDDWILLPLTEGTVQVQIQLHYWFKVRLYSIVRGHEFIPSKHHTWAYEVSISGRSTVRVDFCSCTHHCCMSRWNAFRVTKRPCLLHNYSFSNVPFNAHSLFINKMHTSKHASSNSWNLTTSVRSFRLSLLHTTVKLPLRLSM